MVIERGSNDTTPRYAARKLFLEPLVIPLEQVVRGNGEVEAFRIRQTISQTWIGEQGRGYFVQGIWIDSDLTKFFSRLFLPPGMKCYPFYPYLCRYKTICQSVIELGPERRKTNIPDLHRALEFLSPAMDSIQAVMKSASFSEDMGYFRELKRRVPESWYSAWAAVRVAAYLNESDRREFSLDA
jgi:hypothetical protein